MLVAELLTTAAFCLVLQAAGQEDEQLIAVPPQNVTALSGSYAYLNCMTRSDYNGPFTWRFLGSRQVGGDSIYLVPPYKPQAKYPASRFHWVSPFGLNITSLKWQDGGTYDCNFLLGDAHAYADVVVVDAPQSSISPSVVNVGDYVTLTCAVNFGGPPNDPAYVTPDQIPQLAMKFGNDDMNQQAPLNYTPGQSEISPHRMIRSIRHQVTSVDVLKQLTCIVTTRNPSFSTSSSTVISVRMPAYDITAEPHRIQYTVGEVINCTASGYPPPTVKWIKVNSSSLKNEFDASLVITEDFKGRNSWICVAYNELNTERLVLSLTFVVGNNAVSPDVTVDKSSVGLAVGLVIGISVLVIAIIIIVVIVVRRRRTKQKQSEKNNAPDGRPFIVPRKRSSKSEDSGNNEESRSPPVAKPRVASTITPLDGSASGFADLGAAGISSSTDSLHKILESDGNKPRPRPRTDIRGSTESLDKAVDGRPVPKERPKTNFKGSTESLDKSIEDRPKPKERPRPNLRGSTESLDRSVDSEVKPKSRISTDRSFDTSADQSGKPRPPTAPKPSKTID